MSAGQRRGTPAALRAPLESRDEAAQPTPHLLIPDGCNLGVVLRILFGVNLALLLGVLAGAAGDGDPRKLFLGWAGMAEPVTLLSLILWCLLRRALRRQRPIMQRLIAWSVPPLLTATLLLLFGLLAQPPAQLTLMAAVVAAFAAGASAQHYLELRERAFSPAVAEARFQALQSRIRPHFFFNSLNAVLAVIRDDPARAERMLENIAELFRAVMADVRKLVPLDQELDLCRKYVEIEQTRLGDRLQVHWQLGAVHPRCRVPQLLLQPIIENAVRYGAERLAGQCDIEVRVRQHGFNLEIFVSNPIAREPIQREGNQIGLTNIRGRLALVYDLEARLETRIRRERFELSLSIPVEHKN
jgi:two-component system sensor histidine kinase AlgZ